MDIRTGALEGKGGYSAEPVKPDIAAQGVYPALARALLGELHGNGLKLLEDELTQMPQPRTLVIVGPGSEVIPFSDNLDRVVNMLDGGNLVLMDYNCDICDKIPAYLEARGFDDHFRIERMGKDVFDPREVKNTIFVQQRDIHDGYAFPDDSVSAIDMTVAVHHATMYLSDIERFAEAAMRVLQPGGVLHIGEGDVDMKYSERKINRLGEDLAKGLRSSVVVVDGRNQDGVIRYSDFGGFSDEHAESVLEAEVNPDGIVVVPDSSAYEVLKSAGYKQLYLAGDAVILPLIDHAIEEDFQGMIVPVREYYSSIIRDTLPGLAKDNHADFLSAIGKERSDAERGIVEYYTIPDELCGKLRDAGLRVEEKIYTEHGPFVNILARNVRG